ncbi:Glycosyl transferase family 2 [compost metagenome]
MNDGSAPAGAAVLDALVQQHGQRLQVIHLPRNLGKGGAMMVGLRAALAQGHTHALQIDADGQHRTDEIARFVAAARAQPLAMVCGAPRYDASVPKARLYARYFTHVWVWINTLSLDIRDSMCGMRVYPLAEAVRLFDQARLGLRMEFDTEVLVRLHWRGVAMRTLRTPVVYPQDGISHFQLWRDNALISGMHARLFLGMLVRSPSLLARRWRRKARA